MNPLRLATIPSPLGPITLIADEESLYLLLFNDQKSHDLAIKQIGTKTHRAIIPGRTSIIDKAEEQLQEYFHKKRTSFSIPLAFCGTSFQNNVWKNLATIPWGKTASYAQLAHNVGNEKAYRAVARANATNKLAIIIPCHRIITSAGTLGGYNGGVDKKMWLLNHENATKPAPIQI